MKELKEIELIKKVYEDKGRPNNEVQAFALSCLIEYKKQLLLPNVSQQRELLLAYDKFQNDFNRRLNDGLSEKIVDDFLSNNCG